MAGDNNRRNNSVLLKCLDTVDHFILGLGRKIAWLNLFCLLAILLQVTLRYVFSAGMVVLEEAQWHFYAIVVMMGISYGVIDDAHIRMDFFYIHYSDRKKAWIEVFGLLFFVLPLSLVLCINSLDFVESAWRVGEKSESPLGLPWRWAIKAVLPVSMAFYFAAGLSKLTRALNFLFQRTKA